MLIYNNKESKVMYYGAAVIHIYTLIKYIHIYQRYVCISIYNIYSKRVESNTSAATKGILNRDNKIQKNKEMGTSCSDEKKIKRR